MKNEQQILLDKILEATLIIADLKIEKSKLEGENKILKDEVFLLKDVIKAMSKGHRD